jgi:DNA-binding NarL/FixJ family response regulator
LKSDPQLTVVLADDHPIVRKGLASLIEEDSGLRIVAQESDGLKAWQHIQQLRPNIAVVDFTMPRLTGLEVARNVQEHGLKVAMVLLTMHKEEDLLNDAIDAGVLGYVLKENATDELLNCLRSVAAGQPYLSPALSHFLVRRQQNVRSFAKDQVGLEQLTPAEWRVLKLIAEGRTSKEIGEVLGISSRTVDNHRSKISDKLGLRGTHSLVKFAFDNRSKL